MKPIVPTWLCAAAAALLSVLLWWGKQAESTPDASGKSYYARVHSAMGIVVGRHLGMEQARAQFDKAMSLDPKDAKPAVGMGNLYLQLGRHEEAKAAYEQAVQIDPTDPDARNNLGLILMLSGNAESAIENFKAAITHHADYADGHNNLGYALMQTGQLDQAITTLRRAIDLKCGVNGMHNLGLCLLAKGQVVEALRWLDSAATATPPHPDSINNLAWLLATLPDDTLRNAVKALELAKKANELAGGKNALVLHTLAAALAENGRFEEAETAAQQAITLATEGGNHGLAEATRSQLATYRDKKPWREAQPPR